MSQGVLSDTFYFQKSKNRKQLSWQTNTYGYRPLAKEAFQASNLFINKIYKPVAGYRNILCFRGASASALDAEMVEEGVVGVLFSNYCPI